MNVRLRQAVGVVALVLASGTIAGCQNSASPQTNSPGTQTVATVSASTTTTSPVTHAGTARTLPTCGALRDPFDPADTPPPAGSPARC